jgi:hypothetical protein
MWTKIVVRAVTNGGPNIGVAMPRPLIILEFLYVVNATRIRMKRSLEYVIIKLGLHFGMFQKVMNMDISIGTMAPPKLIETRVRLIPTSLIGILQVTLKNLISLYV